ncbi:hypothetical protein [Aestuariivirga sp.]|uniref:PGN_0703 family putative restriction endonuclease n=1 Tax=Aestuariivirga sp. TaxID=2650926 RepID=UPI00359389A1
MAAPNKSLGLAAKYARTLQRAFASYREELYPNMDHMFEERPKSGPVVFVADHADENLLIPPLLDPAQRQQFIELVPAGLRHQWFRSMQSSQALAQSVFGTIAISGQVSCLAGITAEDGQPAFGALVDGTPLELEKTISTLKEPRPTSIDVWLGGALRVAVECKFAETDFGQCSRPKLRPRDNNHEHGFCDGTYSRQRGRQTNCSLTEAGITYWQHLDALLGWPADMEHRPCPLSSTYQLVRNLLAVCVGEDGVLNMAAGHVLTVYDARNPAMAEDGTGHWQWTSVHQALKQPNLLRRLSWQSLLAQLPDEPRLIRLKQQLAAKYGLEAA